MNDSMFGGMFDFNRDGQMNGFERGAEALFFHGVVLKDNKQKKTKQHSRKVNLSKMQKTDKR